MYVWIVDDDDDDVDNVEADAADVADNDVFLLCGAGFGFMFVKLKCVDFVVIVAQTNECCTGYGATLQFYCCNKTFLFLFF